MPINVPGILAPFHLLWNPRLVVPHLIVKDIRQLDFPELHRAGYRGAVFDKDNCVTIPHQDSLVPEIAVAWRECRETFGENNVLIVSNSAGSHLDAGEIQAESVTYHLSVPVLRHTSLKPSYACIASIRSYFASLPKPVRDEELIIVGDRLLTDIVMANRMAHSSRKTNEPQDDTMSSVANRRSGPLAVWTSGVWQRESLTMRWLEKGILRGVERWIVGNPRSGFDADMQRFVRPLPVPETPIKESIWEKLSHRFSRS